MFSTRRRQTKVILGKPHGYVTRKPAVRPPQVVGQAINWRRTARPRLHTLAILGRPHGYATRKPPVRSIAVRDQAENRAVLQRKLYGHVRLGKPRGTQIVIPSRHVQSLRVVLQAVQRAAQRPRRVHTSAILTRAHGYATRVPPVRRPLAVLQAVARRALTARLRTQTRFTRVYGAPTTPVPPTPPAIVYGPGHKLRPKRPRRPDVDDLRIGDKEPDLATLILRDQEARARAQEIADDDEMYRAMLVFMINDAEHDDAI